MNKNTPSFTDFFNVIENYISSSQKNGEDIVRYLSPQKIKKQINIQISEKGQNVADLIEYAKKYLELSVKTGNKQFLNQLFSGFNFPAFYGEMVVASANTTMATFEAAPVATEIECEIIRLMNTYTGYKKGDGIFVTGGSNSNLIAMFSARNRIFPHGRTCGVDGKLKLKAFVNEHAHYSFDTAANLLGIGTDNVVKVKADSQGRMIPLELEKALNASVEKGETPFFVAATCGTTMLGAFDPIDQMVPICKRFNVWFHVDGAFGGSLILSSKFSHLFKGLEQTDSFTWDAHKLMNVPLVCSVILVKQAGSLQHNIIGTNTDYLYHSNSVDEDLGEKSIQCGRRADAVKLWFSWKFYGKEGYAKRIDNLMAMAAHAEDIVKQTPTLELLSPRQTLSICFRYLPKMKVDLNQFNLAVRENLRKSGKSIVNYGYIGETLAIRLVISNGDMQKEDVEQFFQNFMLVANGVESELNVKQSGLL